ncbi:hypothetical protein JS81_02725 [Thermoactinomyces sp. Gus2-1]|nr:hypothetical protein JS81_02725 [Thermoactinomyces sp. Gus2-1]
MKRFIQIEIILLPGKRVVKQNQRRWVFISGGLVLLMLFLFCFLIIVEDFGRKWVLSCKKDFQ